MTMQVGMEMYARWAHKALWHDFEPGWALHKSHHVPRIGPFEANDVFAIINAVPAFSLCLYGFLTPTLFGGVCFGAGMALAPPSHLRGKSDCARAGGHHLHP